MASDVFATRMLGWSLNPASDCWTLQEAFHTRGLFQEGPLWTDFDELDLLQLLCHSFFKPEMSSYSLQLCGSSWMKGR